MVMSSERLAYEHEFVVQCQGLGYVSLYGKSDCERRSEKMFLAFTLLELVSWQIVGPGDLNQILAQGAGP